MPDRPRSGTPEAPRERGVAEPILPGVMMAGARMRAPFAR